MPGSKPGALGLLATPQCVTLLRQGDRATASGPRLPRSRRAILPAIRERGLGGGAIAEFDETAAAGPGEAWRADPRKRCEHCLDGRFATTQDRLERIAEQISRNEVGYFRGCSIARQIRGLEQVRGGHVDPGIGQHIPGRRQRASGSAPRPRLRPRHSHRARRPGRRRPAAGPGRPADPGPKSSPQSWFRATSTVAASDEPPPNPPPAGMRFSTEMSAPWRLLASDCNSLGCPDRQVIGLGDACDRFAVADDPAIVTGAQTRSCRPSPAAGTRSAAGGSRRRADR